ncbi:unnamed protein product [Pleuronectes platessa]|uniref:Uncharacterized protein n=1 Tax=Pleuronectes platessa TaxID=8262 RepID=A0A9N7YBR4_PLEPL|nr:unnamed protein product [Pleuronectes platessa]
MINRLGFRWLQKTKQWHHLSSKCGQEITDRITSARDLDGSKQAKVLCRHFEVPRDCPRRFFHLGSSGSLDLAWHEPDHQLRSEGEAAPRCYLQPRLSKGI